MITFHVRRDWIRTNSRTRSIGENALDVAWERWRALVCYRMTKIRPSHQGTKMLAAKMANSLLCGENGSEKKEG
jgi:hypothetical protein